MSVLVNTVRQWIAGWNRFWFAPTDLINLSVMRLLLGFHLLTMYGIRYLNFDLFFLNSGLVNAESASSFPTVNMQPLFYLFPHSDTAIHILAVVHLLALLIFMLGAGHRLLYILLFFMNLALLQRNYLILYGADIFTTFWLLYLSFTQCDRYLSVKAWWRGRSNKSWVGQLLGEPRSSEVVSANSHWLVGEKTGNLLDTVGLRLVQLQLCIAYAYTGLEKAKGNQWWEGTAFWSVLANRQFSPFDMTFMAHAPWFIAITTFMVVIWEIYFPCLILFPKTKKATLWLGVVFHVGTACFMGLYFFSGVMLAAYVTLISPIALRRFIFRG